MITPGLFGTRRSLSPLRPFDAEPRAADGLPRRQWHEASVSLKEELPLYSLPMPRPSMIPSGTGQMQEYSLQPVELGFHSSHLADAVPARRRGDGHENTFARMVPLLIEHASNFEAIAMEAKSRAARPKTGCNLQEVRALQCNLLEANFDRNGTTCQEAQS